MNMSGIETWPNPCNLLYNEFIFLKYMVLVKLSQNYNIPVIHRQLGILDTDISSVTLLVCCLSGTWLDRWLMNGRILRSPMMR